MVSERYDEFVFNHPSEGLRQRVADVVLSKGAPFGACQVARLIHERREESLQHIYQVITAELQTASKRRRQMEEELKQLTKKASSMPFVTVGGASSGLAWKRSGLSI